MTEDEFKITIRAFYPTVKFWSYDNKPKVTDRRVNLIWIRHIDSDIFSNDSYGDAFIFRYSYHSNGDFRVYCGDWPESIEDHLTDILKGLKNSGWYRLLDKYE